jgi:tetratricopeptide (TPR) repeat protein
MSQYLIDDELAEQDLLACATRVAETIDNLEGHAELMAGAAARYADAGQFDFAVALAETIGDPYTRDRARAHIAVKSFEAGESDYAMRLLEGIEDPSFQAYATAQIAVRRAAAGDYAGGAELAHSLEDSSSTLAEIAVKCAEAGHYDEALELVGTIDYQGSAASALTEMAAIHTKAGRQKEASELLSQALLEARSIELAEDRVSMLVSIGTRYAEAGEQDKAEEVLLEAERLAERVELDSYRDNSLEQVSLGLARLGQSERALEVAARIEDSFQAASAHTGISSEHLRAGRSDEAQSTLSRALELVEAEEFYRSSSYPASRYNALTGIAMQYAEAALYDQATRTARMIESDRDRSAALMEVAKTFMRAGNTDHALNAARMIEDSSIKAVALTTLAQALSKNDQQERALSVLAEATRTAEEITWANDRTLALIEIARRYASAEGHEDEAAKLLLQALETSVHIESRYGLASALAQLSDAYDETGLEIDERVMNILREIVIKLD